jgi:hypothetical protein
MGDNLEAINSYSLPSVLHFFEGEKTISVPLEIFQKILKYLPFTTVQKLRLVQHPWKLAIDSPAIKDHFSNGLKFSLFPARLSCEKYIEFLKGNLSSFLDEINLDYFDVTDSDLKELSGLKTHCLRLRTLQGSITTEGFITFLRSGVLASPSALHLNGEAQEWFNDAVLQELIDQKINFSVLNLNCASHPIMSGVSSEKFCEFVSKGGLNSPCTLDLTGCTWVNSEVINAFIQHDITFTKLKLSETAFSRDDFNRLLKSGALTLCQILEFDKTELAANLDTPFLTSLSEAATRLRNLDLADTRVSAATFAKFVREGRLATPISLKVSEDLLTQESLAALKDKKIEIEKLEITPAPLHRANSVQNYQQLFEEAHWFSACSLTFNGSRLNDESLNWLSKVSLKELIIRNSHGITTAKFCEFIKAGRLKKQHFKFQVDKKCKWLNNTVLNAFAEAKIKFKFLYLRNCKVDLTDGLVALCQAGAFDSLCDVLLPQNLQLSLLMPHLAKTKINELMIVGTSWEKAIFLKLFENPTNFAFLRVLQIMACPWFDEGCATSLSQTRPYLNLF